MQANGFIEIKSFGNLYGYRYYCDTLKVTEILEGFTGTSIFSLWKEVYQLWCVHGILDEN